MQGQLCVKMIHFMQKIVWISLVLLITSCTKHMDATPSRQNKVFFASPDEASEIVKAMVHKYNPGETFQAIDRISYLYAGSDVYAFVFYRTDVKTTNLVVHKKYEVGVQTMMESWKCQGQDCDCLILATIGNDGSVTVKCTCPSCTMLVNSDPEN